jgi:hypothetical protein
MSTINLQRPTFDVTVFPTGDVNMQQCYQWVHRNTPKQLYKSRPHDDDDDHNTSTNQQQQHYQLADERAICRNPPIWFYSRQKQPGPSSTDQQLGMFCFYETTTRSNFICGHTILKESVSVTDMFSDAAVSV